MAADKALRLAFILSATDKMSRVVAQAVKKSTNELTAFERNASRVGGSMMKAGGILVGAGAAIGVATFGVAKATANYGDELYKTSQKAGVGFEQYQKLAYAAKYAGVENNTLAGGLNKLNKVMVAANSGSKEQAQIFKDLGINLKDAQGKLRKPDEVFRDFAGIFDRIEDGAEKSDLAMKLFGKSGTELIPLLNSGIKGLDDMGSETERMGLVLSDEAGKACEQFNDNVTRVTDSAKGMVMQLGAVVMPMLDQLVTKISGTIQKITAWIQENPQLVQTIGNVAMAAAGILLVLGTASVVIGGITFAVGKFGAILRGVNTVIQISTALVKGMAGATMVADKASKAYVIGQKLAAAATAVFNAVMAANPIVFIIAGIVALGAAVYLLIKHWDKVSAFFKRLWSGIKAIFMAVWDWIKNMFLNYTPAGLVIKHWDKIKGWFANLWEGVKSISGKAWQWIKNIFLSYTPVGLVIKHWESIKGWFASLWDNVTSTFVKAWDWIKNMFLNYTPVGLIIKHWDQITTWFANLWVNVKTVLVNAWNKIGEFFGGLKARFMEWGRNIIQGLIDGITGMIGNVWETIKGIGQRIGDTFKNILGINSPSRVFAEYGVNITQGLAGGINKGGGVATKATESMAAQVMNGAEQSMTASTVSTSHMVTNMGGAYLNYAPNITITGVSTSETEQSFAKLLRAHRDEIIDIMNREASNRMRLSFGG